MRKLSTVGRYVEILRRSVGRIDMADKSKCRRGTVVWVMRGRFSRFTSESCPTRDRHRTGRPGRIDAAASAEPRKEQSWGSALGGRSRNPECRSDNLRCRKVVGDTKKEVRIGVYAWTPFALSAPKEHDWRWVNWHPRITLSIACMGGS